MKRLAVLTFWLLILVPVAAYSNDLSDCIVCHNGMTGKVVFNGQEINLNVDAGRFEKSVHGFLSCTDCHERFGDNPHTPPAGPVTPEVADVAKKIAGKAAVDPVALASCYKCHDQVYKQVLGSVHGRNVVEKGSTDGALCLDCHGSPHYIVSVSDKSSPLNQWKVVETCGKCHGRKDLAEKYGIEANVMKSYEESFHGKKHTLGLKRAPTCVSCHGAHDIKSKDDPSSPVFNTDNKIELCGKCHKGANRKFVAAITHREAGPIPHYAEKGLILLTMSVIAFTVIHVILEAFSDIRDTFFRKTKEEEDE